jgi:hypothetical protein
MPSSRTEVRKLPELIVGIHQPNYLPWLGYFRKVALSNVFVFFDNVQMPGGKSFVSRNAVKTANGRQWLTVPVSGKGRLPIAEVPITDQAWPRKHLRTLELSYRNLPGLAFLDAVVRPVLEQGHDRLAELNMALIEAIIRGLGFADVEFVRASALDLKQQGAATIPEILGHCRAAVYATGQGAGSTRHLDIQKLRDASIETRFVSSLFPEHVQPHGPFDAGLSIIDAILCLGPEASAKMLCTDPWAPAPANAGSGGAETDNAES